MSKYIDADGVMRACYDSFLKTGNKAYHKIFSLVEAVPAADVVAVVRCRECKWLEKWHKELPLYDTGLYCTRPNQQSVNLLPTDYCSYGERKDG